ncbi:Adenylate cyclase [Vulgatibacter incomptus]|uniref:Adenylate cyclase n=1 Tax=Vulgatibacter incomptus TaxID=1391653 RepID=A0A0K1PAV5_9BACT|nr:Adenylate cyclase [Vulgatibacter incomptus]
MSRISGGQGGAAMLGDRSAETFVLEEVGSDAVFGRGPDVSVPTGERASFLLPAIGAEPGESRFTVRYSSSLVKPDAIEVRVNDEVIGFVAGSGAAWKRDQEIRLPARVLRPGERNVLAFVDPLHGAPNEQAEWQVGEIELVVEPIPHCDPVDCIEQAERHFALGSRAFEARALAPRSLFDAWLSLRMALRFVENLSARPGVHGRIVALLGEVDVELQARCSRLRFTVERSVALDELGRARSAADELLRTFPGPEHRCHGMARQMLSWLDG